MRKRRSDPRYHYAVLEILESRQLLSVAIQLPHVKPFRSRHVRAVTELRPTYTAYSPTGSLSPLQTSGPQGYTPSEIRAAYGLNQVSFGGVTGDGAGQTIAIIDAYNDPTIQNDLRAFDAAFGLANPTLRVVNQAGGTTLPPVDPSGAGSNNFEGEIALDVEWAHALAPGASIMLVEAQDASPSNLFAAVNFARQQAGVSVISMSFGGNETSSQTQYDSVFTTTANHIGVTFVASTGDSGTPGGYPAYSPNVVATGGTSLAIDSVGNYQSETGWTGSGGGISQVESQPSYQSRIVTQSTTFRAAPDVAFVADPSTGVAVYDSYNNGTSRPWEILGGTSVAAPAWAGIFAVANQGRVAAGEGTLDSRTGTLPLLYSAPAADFHDITTGNNGFSAGAGYDLVTGRGSPKANLLIPFLVSGSVVVTPPPTNTGPVITSVTASDSTVTEGSPLILTAQGISDPGANGVAVTFYEETNGVPGLQTGTNGDFAFTPVTDGSNAITLDTTNTTGTFTFYAQVTDASGRATLAGSAAPSVVVTVVAPSTSGPSIGAISANPSPVVSGDPLTLTATGVSDPNTSVRRVYFYEETNGIPGLQTGPGGDFGFRPTTAATRYSVQLDTTGVSGALTFYGLAVDSAGNVSAEGTSAPSVAVNIASIVLPDPPTSLTATAVSTTEVDLSFAETDSGQTGFTIQRALDSNFTNFTQLFTINRPDILTYKDAGLTPNTRYFYRVEAFNLAGDSAFSNTALATTPLPGAQLAIVQQPENQAAGAPPRAIIVQVNDINGHLASVDNSIVTLTIASGPAGASIGGTATAQAVNGVAIFSNFLLPVAGHYTLLASAPNLTPATSHSFIVVPNAAGAHLVLAQQPQSTIAAENIFPQLIVELKDQFGNVITSPQSKTGSKATVAVFSGPAGASLKGAMTAHFNNGVAAFHNLSLSKAGSYTLLVTDPGLAGSAPLELTEIILPGVTFIPTPPATTGVEGKTVALVIRMKSSAPALLAFSGSVSIRDQTGATIALASVRSNGMAKFLFSGLAAGTYTCTLVYPGDANHTAAASSAFVLTIKAAPRR